MAIHIWKINDITEANKNEPKIYIISTLDKKQIKVEYHTNSDKFIFEKEINDEDKNIIENHFRNNMFKVINK